MNPTELGLVLASALLHAVWSTAIKGSRDPLIFNLLQCGITLVLSLGVLGFVAWGEIPAATWRWFVVASLGHGLYYYWLSQALTHGDLTLVYPIARSTPAFLPLLAVPLFGETLTVAGALGIAVVVGGLWLVQSAEPIDRRAWRSPAARYALLTLLATIAYGVADKGAMAALAAEPPSGPIPVAVLYYALLHLGCSLVFAPLAFAARGAARIVAEAPALLRSAALAALIGWLGYGLILKALETAPASYVVAVRQASVFFALLLGIALLRERPPRPRWIGALTTILGVALIARFGA